MTEELTPEQRLFDSYTKVLDAQARVQMAQQTLQGAEREYADKQSRFNGQLEFVAGGPCSWKVDVEKRAIVVELLPEPPKSEAEIVQLPGIGAADAPAGPEEPAPAAPDQAAAEIN